MERCDECAYEYGGLSRAEIAPAVRELGSRYALLLSSASDHLLPAHTADGVWSPLEYACHIRDVFRVQRERVALALLQDEPTFASMRREERVSEERYNEQEPIRVAAEIGASADAFADALDALDEAGWSRAGIYNYPEVQVRTIEWIGRHTVHEGVHHLLDIERLLPTIP